MGGVDVAGQGLRRLDPPTTGLLFGDDVSVVADVLLLGEVVDVAVRLDEAEHRRRQEVGLGAVAHPRLLRCLLDVPSDQPINDPCLYAETSCVPAGIVERGVDDGVRRLLRPPLSIDGVVVRAARNAGHRQVRAASLFAGFCPRWVVADRPRVDPAVFVAVSVFNVGLAVRDPDPEVIVVAGPARPNTLPEWDWCLAEQTYARWLAAAGPPTVRHVAMPTWLLDRVT
jgi:hypothetical protein